MAGVQEVKNVSSSDRQHATLVTLCNQTPTTMTLGRSFTWSGLPGPIPNRIMPGGCATFTAGSMSVVIYDGLNALAKACSWVLAWDSRPDGDIIAPGKVYVICGYKHAIDNMSFDEIRRSMDNVGPTSEYVDIASQTRASATITQNHGIVTVGSNFGLATI